MGNSRVQQFFLSKLKSFQYRDKVSHTGELWKISKPHTPGNYENLQSLHTPHSTEATHRGTLKIFKVSTHHRAHTPENFENFQSPNTQHRAHTPGNFQNFQSTHTQWNFENFFKSPHHSTEHYFPDRGFQKNQSLPVREFLKNPQYRDFSWKTNLSSTGAPRSALKKTL